LEGSKRLARFFTFCSGISRRKEYCHPGLTWERPVRDKSAEEQILEGSKTLARFFTFCSGISRRKGAKWGEHGLKGMLSREI